jgi:hypothetical protein
VTRKLQPKWRGPYRIIEQKGPVTFKIREISGRKEEMVHANRLKICKGEPEPWLQREDVMTRDTDESSEEQLDVSIINPVKPTAGGSCENMPVTLSDSEESTSSSSAEEPRPDNSDSESNTSIQGEEINDEEINVEPEIDQEGRNENAEGINLADSRTVETADRPRRNVRRPRRLDDFYSDF